MSREATDSPAAVNVLDVSSESMAGFQVFLYGRFWVFTEGSVLFHVPQTSAVMAPTIPSMILAAVETHPSWVVSSASYPRQFVI